MNKLYKIILIVVLFFIFNDDVNADIINEPNCFVEDTTKAIKEKVCSNLGTSSLNINLSYDYKKVGLETGCYCTSNEQIFLLIDTKNNGMDDVWKHITISYLETIDINPKQVGSKVCKTGYIRKDDYCYKCEIKTPENPENPENPSYPNQQTFNQANGGGKCVIYDFSVSNTSKIDVCKTYIHPLGYNISWTYESIPQNRCYPSNNDPSDVIIIETVQDGFNDKYVAGGGYESRKVCQEGWVRKGQYCYKCDEYTTPTKPTNGNTTELNNPIDTGGEVTCDAFKEITGPIWFWMRILAPIIALVFGTLDLLKAVAAEDQKAVKKATSDFMKRIGLTALLFLLPFIINMIVGLTQYGSLSACL
jgi:hypothetical protein